MHGFRGRWPLAYPSSIDRARGGGGVRRVGGVERGQRVLASSLNLYFIIQTILIGDIAATLSTLDIRPSGIPLKFASPERVHSLTASNPFHIFALSMDDSQSRMANLYTIFEMHLFRVSLPKIAMFPQWISRLVVVSDKETDRYRRRTSRHCDNGNLNRRVEQAPSV